MKTMESASVTDELCRFKEEDELQIVSLGDWHKKACMGSLSYFKHANS